MMTLVMTSNAFSTNTLTTSSIATQAKTSVSTSSQSSLFRTKPMIQSSYIRKTMMAATNDENNEEEENEKDVPLVQEATISSSSTSLSSSPTTTSTSSEQDRNALMSVLFLAPPLIAKFGIVILVKIATDMVVFPLLYMYRFCHIAKSKTVNVLMKSKQLKFGILKGDKINGAS